MQFKATVNVAKYLTIIWFMWELSYNIIININVEVACPWRSEGTLIEINY